MKTAFNAGDYQDRYGSALSELAGAQYMAGQDQLSDPNSTIDYDQENAVSRQNASAQSSSANLPGPWQMFRGAPQPPGPAFGGGTKQNTGTTSPQSSSPFFDQDQKQSADVYDYTDNASQDELKAHARHIDETVGAGTGDHGIEDMEHLWRQTYQQQLQSGMRSSMADQDAAQAYMNPSWKDKLAMMLDSANRASIISAQNPQMSKGQVWAAATRGALDGWQAHAQGAHDAYLASQNAMREQAGKQADAAVKRRMDVLGLAAKGATLKLNQDKLDEEKRNHDLEHQDRQATNEREKNKAGEAAKKGDLVTLSQDYTDPKTGQTYTSGSLVRIDADGHVVSTGAAGTKTGTNATKQADAVPYDKAEAAWKEYVTNFRKDPKYIGKPEAAEQDAKASFAKQNPRAYKAFFGDEPDVNKPPAAPSGTPSWVKPKQQ